MNKYKIGFLIFVFSCLCILILYGPSIHLQTIANSVIKEDNATTTKHVEWILNHSSRISRQGATDMYSFAMSMEKGLLFVAIAYVESNFNPTAISKKGAIGLNQIMPNIWTKELKEQKIIKEKKDLFNYDKNLLASHYILTKYYKKSGSWKEALVRYVGGDKKYAEKVFAAYGELQLLTAKNDKK